jgi:hypothetical protein
MLLNAMPNLISLSLAHRECCWLVDKTGPEELDEPNTFLGGQVVDLGFGGERHAGQDSRPSTRVAKGDA